MNPRPLKFSEVLQSTPTPWRSPNALSSACSRALLSAVTVWRAGRAVDVRDRPQVVDRDLRK